MSQSTSTSTSHRRKFLTCLSGIGIGTGVFHRSLAAQVAEAGKITSEMVASAEWIAGIELEEEEREQVASALQRSLRDSERLREQEVDADTVPALVFRPDVFYQQVQGSAANQPGNSIQVAFSVDTQIPQLSETELAFASIAEQASLLARKQISSRELTGLYLARLKQYDPLLKCVVTLLEEHALEQASASDGRRTRNATLSVLDGIPWVAKDLIAIPPWKTTWGAEPFRDQIRSEQATVSRQLDESGAVLLAKVSLGALAWGDRWFEGMTRNPWNPEQGSSGSSAGSAAAVAAGLASFALGSETLGSIVSPTRRCRTSGLRPTFGRVSRAGCMPLAWSMDKIGPIARHIQDLALVFPHLLGTDGKDPTLVEKSFQWPINRPISSLKVGLAGRLSAMEAKALAFLESEGAAVTEISLESELPTRAMNFILGVEAATVFDDAFRSDPKADFGNWPATFRQSQFVPAVQYLRANRFRSKLIRETEERLTQVDVVMGGNDLLLTNLTGHPSLVVACGTDESNETRMPGVVKLTAAAYREDLLLHVAHKIQSGMPPLPKQPNLDAEHESD